MLRAETYHIHTSRQRSIEQFKRKSGASTELMQLAISLNLVFRPRFKSAGIFDLYQRNSCARP